MITAPGRNYFIADNLAVLKPSRASPGKSSGFLVTYLIYLNRLILLFWTLTGCKKLKSIIKFTRIVGKIILIDKLLLN